MNEILSYLIDKSPEIAIAVIVGWIAWKVGRFLYKHEKKVSDVEKEIIDLKSVINALKSNIIDLQLVVTSKYPTALSTFAQKHSPIQLNELGQKLYNDCNGKEFLEANQVLLLSLIDKKKPQTALDVEMYAKEVLLSLTNDSIFNQIKVWVYNSPALEVGDNKNYTITLADVCFVLSIPLRDKYLELHKEIAQ